MPLSTFDNLSEHKLPNFQLSRANVRRQITRILGTDRYTTGTWVVFIVVSRSLIHVFRLLLRVVDRLRTRA